jgi:hypothetical protein
MIRKTYLSDNLSVHDGERAVVAKICVPVVDRDGEVVMPQGCVSKDFEINPVVFYSHSYQVPGMQNLPPVGKCKALKREGDCLVAKTVFASRPDNHPQGAEWLPDTLFSLYQQGVLKGFSIGFSPIESRAATKGDREVYGPTCKTIYSKWNMLEYSVAPIPCNQEAVVIAVSKGIITADGARTMFGMNVELEKPITAPIVVPKRVTVVYRQRTPEPEPVNVDSLLTKAIDKRCGVLYSE